MTVKGKPFYPVALLATSLVNLGIRNLKSQLKKRGVDSILYFLNTTSARYCGYQITQIIKALKKQNPKIIGISTIEFSAVKTKQLLEAIRGSILLKDKILVSGGIHATICPEEYINISDIVIIGEGEEAFLELTEDVLKNISYDNIKNLWIRKKKHIIKNELRPLIGDLNRLPFEDYSPGEYLLHKNKLMRLDNAVVKSGYPPPGTKNIFLFTARGCVRSCSFCINSGPNKIWPKCVRKRDLIQVVEYLIKIKSNNPDLKLIYLMENNFFLRTENEIHQFSEMYKNTISLPFFVNGTPDTVTKTKLELLSGAGLKILNIGIQSGSDTTNKLIYNRNITGDKLLKSAEIISMYSNKIEVVYDIIVNNPYETENDLLATIDLIKKIPKPFHLHVHYLIFYKGCALYKKAVADTIIGDEYNKAIFDFHMRNHNLDKHSNFYFNSIISWMNGSNRSNRYGLLPPRILEILISEKHRNLFKKFTCLVSFVNWILSKRGDK